MLNRNLDASQTRVARSPAGSRSLLLEVLEIVVLAIILYAVIQFAVEPVRVIGVSMNPTLADQDYLVATRIDYRFHHPERGDIVIMRDPFDPSKDFIKRVIALPHDELRIHDGRVYIDGHLLEEPYLSTNEPWTVLANWPADPNQTDVIPDGEYFVMGDNRNHSTDSRTFGPVRVEEIEAHAWVRFWPFDHFGLVNSSPHLEG